MGKGRPLLYSVLVNTAVWGGELGVITIGLSLSYAVIGYANWAHAELVTVGAYMGLWASTSLGLPLPAAAVVAMVLTGLVAVALEFLVFRWLRTASVGAKMLATVGVAVVIRALVQYFGGVTAQFYSESLPTLAFTLGTVRVNTTQLWIVAAAGLSLVSFYLLLRRTGIGRVLRATADNFTLAEVRGINGNRVVRMVWFIAGAYAGLGGVLLGVETFVRPQMGLSILLPLFAAATVGGLGNLNGALLGALLLAFSQNLLLAVNWGDLVGAGSWFIASGYKSALALVFLVGVILLRPKGLFARATSRV